MRKTIHYRWIIQVNLRRVILFCLENSKKALCFSTGPQNVNICLWWTTEEMFKLVSDFVLWNLITTETLFPYKPMIKLKYGTPTENTEYLFQQRVISNEFRYFRFVFCSLRIEPKNISFFQTCLTTCPSLTPSSRTKAEDNFRLFIFTFSLSCKNENLGLPRFRLKKHIKAK